MTQHLKSNQTLKTIPVWAQPSTPTGWPTKQIENAELYYTLPVPMAWSHTPQVSQEPTTMVHVYRGSQPEEWLVIDFMPQADPNANMCNWVNAIVDVTGFPLIPLLQETEVPPKLLEWQYLGACPPLASQLSMDETHLYSGLAKWSIPYPSLGRLYQLLARRGTMAWKVTLVLTSACLLGMPEEMVIANDHVRAGATFGYLSFL